MQAKASVGHARCQKMGCNQAAIALPQAIKPASTATAGTTKHATAASCVLGSQTASKVFATTSTRTERNSDSCDYEDERNHLTRTR